MIGLEAYATTAWLLAAMAFVTVVQVLVADVARVRARHTPGVAINTGPSDFVWRADRAHANTLENLPPFVVAVLAAVLVGADADAVAIAAGVFVAARVVHMLAYYRGLPLIRTAGFVAGLIAIGGLLVLVPSS